MTFYFLTLEGRGKFKVSATAHKKLVVGQTISVHFYRPMLWDVQRIDVIDPKWLIFEENFERLPYTTCGSQSTVIEEAG